MTKPILEECNELVSEVLLAWQVMCDQGRQLTGADLLAFRELPSKERAYFAALTTPIEDPHAATRVQTISPPDEQGRRVIAYDPPMAEPCACARPVYVSWSGRTQRCARCLHCWRIEMVNLMTCPCTVMWPLIDSVARADMGHAIEVMAMKGPR